MNTYTQKPAEVQRKWYVVDGSGQTLGRLASNIARMLIGKDKPTFTPHVDGGDYVVVINAKKVKVTGNKLLAKKYYRHSQHPGSLKETNVESMMAKNPAKVIELAVKGMLPKNKLQAARLTRLKVYPGAEHPHQAQKLTELGVSP